MRVNNFEPVTLRILVFFKLMPFAKFGVLFCLRMKQWNMIDTDPNHAIMNAVSAETTVFLLMNYGGFDTMKTGETTAESMMVRRQRCGGRLA